MYVYMCILSVYLCVCVCVCALFFLVCQVNTLFFPVCQNCNLYHHNHFCDPFYCCSNLYYLFVYLYFFPFSGFYLGLGSSLSSSLLRTLLCSILEIPSFWICLVPHYRCCTHCTPPVTSFLLYLDQQIAIHPISYIPCLWFLFLYHCFYCGGNLYCIQWLLLNILSFFLCP